MKSAHDESFSSWEELEPVSLSGSGPVVYQTEYSYHRPPLLPQMPFLWSMNQLLRVSSNCRSSNVLKTSFSTLVMAVVADILGVFGPSSCARLILPNGEVVAQGRAASREGRTHIRVARRSESDGDLCDFDTTRCDAIVSCIRLLLCPYSDSGGLLFGRRRALWHRRTKNEAIQNFLQTYPHLMSWIKLFVVSVL